MVLVTVGIFAQIAKRIDWRISSAMRLLIFKRSQMNQGALFSMLTGLNQGHISWKQSSAHKHPLCYEQSYLDTTSA